jgi:hypothetical protein
VVSGPVISSTVKVLSSLSRKVSVDPTIPMTGSPT